MLFSGFLEPCPLHILSVKSMILKGNQKIARKPKQSYYVHHVKIMGLKWQSNFISYIKLRQPLTYRLMESVGLGGPR